MNEAGVVIRREATDAAYQERIGAYVSLGARDLVCRPLVYRLVQDPSQARMTKECMLEGAAAT